MTRSNTELAPPLKALQPAGGRLDQLLGFNFSQAQYATDLQWNRVSNLEASAWSRRTLSGHRRPLLGFASSRLYIIRINEWIKNSKPIYNLIIKPYANFIYLFVCVFEIASYTPE
ncbi:hypothetical protein AVEN_11548-1 [Araneus ventricosus]|uniref:Uncharacterized protein n=1 Tax=Araneus ventricosus TaxID=182803 RepID=A0A4Y2MGX5_ARAVE|nr:hypothetical protein AVEN_11548-1 [Araneus ventricosus]